MRSVSVRGSGAALLLFLVLGTVPVAADALSVGTEPPQARIHIPGGVAADQEPEEEVALWDLFLVWLQGRIHIPGG